MKARTDALADLGLKAVPHPSGIGEHITADPSGQTEVPGVWAAGNVTDMTAQVGASPLPAPPPAPGSTTT